MLLIVIFFIFQRKGPPVEKQEKCLSGCFHGRAADPHPAPCLFSSCHGVWLSGDQRQDVWWHSSASSPWSWGKLFMKWVQIIICCGRIVLPCQKPESVGQLVGRLAQAISARNVGSMCRPFGVGSLRTLNSGWETRSSVLAVWFSSLVAVTGLVAAPWAFLPVACTELLICWQTALILGFVSEPLQVCFWQNWVWLLSFAH